jgi:hypothetical protein
VTDSPNLAMPYLETGQSQKEVTHNEALNLLDALTQGAVVNATTTAPPGSPTDGQAWIVAAGATGAWAGKAGQIAAWFSGWRFLVPKEGWRVWDKALDVAWTHNGTAWVVSPAAQVPTLGGSWVGYGGGYAGPRYYKAADGLVTIEGMAQSGADGTLFTLLSGYRPAARLVFCCWSGGGAYRVDVDTNGDVILTGSDTVFSSLAGISFFAA